VLACEVLLSIVAVRPALADAAAQADLADVYYQVNGLVYMRSVTEQRGPQVGGEATQTLAEEGLKFRVIGSVIADPDLPATVPPTKPVKTFQVIEFYPIKEDKQAADKNLNRLYIEKYNARRFAIAKDAFDTYLAQGYIQKRARVGVDAVHLTYGAALSVPFKLRRHTAEHNRDIVTDVTLAGYFGPKWRISAEHEFFVSLVGNAGLALVPINSSSTTSAADMDGNTTVPAVTVAGGVIFQLDSFQLGFLTGRDYASGDLGSTWIYNAVQWYSFSLGFSFLGGSTEAKK
jgi:hypothetical protein